MAQIIERIVRSKYPPRDTRVLWLDTKNDLLKAFTSNGWTKVFANTAINTLRNAGYLFAGIATIDTNPETPDAKVFYIANGKGTYTHFGELEVTEDEVVFLIWDSSWHKVSTGIASQEKLTELEREVNNLNGEVFGEASEVEETLGIVKSYVGYSRQASNMSVYNKPSMTTSYYPIKAGSKLQITIPKTGNSFHQAIFYLDTELATFPDSVSVLSANSTTATEDGIVGTGGEITHVIETAGNHGYIGVTYEHASGEPILIQTISESSTPRVVKVTEQTFSELEKQTARGNIGALGDDGLDEINQELFSHQSEVNNPLSESARYDGYGFRADDSTAYGKSTMSSILFPIHDGAKISVDIPLTGSNFYRSVFYYDGDGTQKSSISYIAVSDLTPVADAVGNNGRYTTELINTDHKYLLVDYVVSGGYPVVSESYQVIEEARVVKVTEQNFTESEKQTARANLGILEGKRTLKVLVMGNSFSQDSFGYAPFIVKALKESCDLTIGLCVIGGCKMVQHCANFTNVAQILGDTTYNPTNYAYFEYANNASAWTNQASKSASQALAMHDWDIITFQQNGMDNYKEYATYYEPFCNKTFKALNAMVAKPVKIGWLLTHGSYVWSRADARQHWEGSRTNSQKVMNETSASVLFPYGTAIENLRTTSITTSYKDALLADDAHLQEGISTLCASYSIALTLLKELGYEEIGIWGDRLRPDLTWLNAHNIPGMNFAQSGVVEGITEDNCRLAQAAAIKAEMAPYEVTDISSW